MLKDEIRKVYEKIRENTAIKKAFMEGKIAKYDESFLEELAHYDYGRFPLLTCILCPKLFTSDINEITLVLANFLLLKGQVNLLKDERNGYYILELVVDDKKYIYDIAKKLVFAEDYYFAINPDINYKKTMFTDNSIGNSFYNKFLVQVIDSEDTRDELIDSMLRDYKNNIDMSYRTANGYVNLNSKTKRARKFKREKIFYFD